MAPHIYPPSISKATDRYTGSSLYYRLTKSFGSLNKEGYCLPDGRCHQFALAIGETGTAFEDPRDATCMADFAKYLTNTGNDDTSEPGHPDSASYFLVMQCTCLQGQQYCVLSIQRLPSILSHICWLSLLPRTKAVEDLFQFWFCS